MNRDKELWAMTLWVEKHHGADGMIFIAKRIADLMIAGEPGGVDLWREVAERLQKLSTPNGTS